MPPSTLKKMTRTLTHPRALELLLEAHTFTCLEMLLQKECTLSQLAQKTRLSAGSTLYRIQQLMAYGFVEVAHEEKRSGRAIKHYRTTAEAFYIPFAITSAETAESMCWRMVAPLFQHAMNALLKQARDQNTPLEKGGILFQKDPSGEAQIKMVSENLKSDYTRTASSAHHFHWETLHLTHEQARALNTEMMALLSKYQSPSGPHSYVVFSGLTLDDAK